MTRFFSNQEKKINIVFNSIFKQRCRASSFLQSVQSLINDSRVKVIVKTYEVAVLRYSVFLKKENRTKHLNFDLKQKILLIE